MIIVWIFLVINLLAVIIVLIYGAYKLARENNFDEQTVVTEYSIPKNLRPMEVGVLVDNELHGRDLSAEIMQLCLEGYLKIERERKDYRITKLKDLPVNARSFDKHLISFLLPLGDSNLVQMIQPDSSTYFDYFKQSVMQELIDAGYYGEKAATTLKFKNHPVTYLLIIGGLVGFCSSFYVYNQFSPLNMPEQVSGDDLLALSWLFAFLGALAIMPGAAVVFFVLKFLQPKIVPLTHNGRLTQRNLLGFKHYLNVAEIDRLSYEYRPKEDLDRVNKLLPYAVALNCDKNWTKYYQHFYGAVPENLSNVLEFSELFDVVLSPMIDGYKDKIISLANFKK